LSVTLDDSYMQYRHVPSACQRIIQKDRHILRNCVAIMGNEYDELVIAQVSKTVSMPEASIRYSLEIATVQVPQLGAKRSCFGGCCWYLSSWLGESVYLLSWQAQS
jgi:hypothetical protein